MRTFEPIPLPTSTETPPGALVEIADLADEARVTETLAAAETSGGIAGVVVREGLGLDLPETPLALLPRERLDEALAAAEARLTTLARLLAASAPGFCLVASGLASRSGAGQILAAAVDSVAAAFAEQQAESGPLPWAVLHRDPDEGSAAVRPAVLHPLLARGTARLVASPEEPGARIDRLRAAALPAPEAAPPGVTLHARPNLRNPYVRPRPTPSNGSPRSGRSSWESRPWASTTASST